MDEKNKQVKAKATLKYARSELFSLAERVGDEHFRKELKSFEEADRSKDNLDFDSNSKAFISNGHRFAGKPFKLTRSVSNFNRTNSLNNYFKIRDEASEKSRLANDDRWSTNSRDLIRSGDATAFGSSTKSLSRMTSSPSIKYNRRGSTHSNGLVGGQIPANERHPTLLSKASSSDEDARNQHQHKSRKRHAKKQNLVRRNTLESQSLLDGNSDLKSGLLSDSPIKRITSDKRAQNSKEEVDEDDDFELTSLVSITVLSDIKTIRRELQASGGVNGRTQLSSSSGRKGRFKAPTRANSSMEFSHYGRALNPLRDPQAVRDVTENLQIDCPPDSSLIYECNNDEQDYDTGEPQSLMGFQYDWDTNVSFGLNTNLLAQTNPRYSSRISKANTKKPDVKQPVIDEAAEQIRELFMAEVRARAKREFQAEASKDKSPDVTSDSSNKIQNQAAVESKPENKIKPAEEVGSIKTDVAKENSMVNEKKHSQEQRAPIRSCIPRLIKIQNSPIKAPETKSRPSITKK